MTTRATKADVYQALSQVRHPEIQSRSLVDLGMIPEVHVRGSQVRVNLALPSLNVPMRQEMVEKIRSTITGLEGGLKAEVRVIEMDDAQRKNFQSMVKEERIIQPKPGAHIRRVLAVMSGKGGVGKSSVAGLLASSLRKRSLEVGILDADITGPCIPKMFGVHQIPEGGPEGIFPIESRLGIKMMSINLLLPDEDQAIVWRGPLISRAIQQFWGDIVWGDLDVLVVDLPPGTSDASITVMQSLPLDGIVMVTSPQDLAGMVVRKAAHMADSLGVRLVGLVENMSFIICPHCGRRIDMFGPSRAEDTARWIGTKLLGHLPLDPQLSVLCDEGAIEAYQNHSLEQITDQVIDLLQIRELKPLQKRERA